MDAMYHAPALAGFDPIIRLGPCPSPGEKVSQLSQSCHNGVKRCICSLPAPLTGTGAGSNDRLRRR